MMFPKKGKSRKITITTPDKWFSIVVRLTHLIDGTEYVKCVTCGRVLHWSLSQCGHYISRGKPMTRFYMKNCHPQCPTCNKPVSQGGLGGNLINYSIFIEKTYGAGTAKKLKDLSEIRGANIPLDKMYTKVKLKEISDEFKIDAKKLANEKGIKL